MNLSISIVSWNVKECLRDCLRSIYDTVDNLSFEVIVVDNNSDDGSAQMVKDEFPSVKLLENKRNYGFAAANNQAIRQAKAKYILLLNPDTLVLPETIENMLHFMNSHPGAGISGCGKIDQNGNTDLSDTLIGRYKPFSFKLYKFFKLAISDGLADLFPNNKIIKKNLFNINTAGLGFNLCDRNEPAEVDVVWGTFMMIRKELINQVGEFDERIFFTTDDDDFCYRAKKAGWKIYLCLQYKIVHLHERSISQWSEKRKQDVKTYSRFIFYSKHKGKIWLCFNVFKIISVKILIKGFFLVLDLIFLIKGIKSKKEYMGSCLSTDIRNLSRIMFNVSPQFNRYRDD